MGSQHEILWHNLSKETGLPWCLLLSARSAPDFNTALWCALVAHYHCVLAVLALSSLSGLCSKSPACQAVPGMAQSHRELTHNYLDGGGAALLVLALTQQAIRLHIVPGHWHGLHNMQAVAAMQRNQNQQQDEKKPVLCGRMLW